MKRLLLDNPLTHAMMFHPRRTPPGTSSLPDVTDGTIPTHDGIAIGYRLYHHAQPKAFLLQFHGNGETAADSDWIAPTFREMGLIFMVAEFRGYGWSEGRVRGSHVLPDAEAVMRALPALRKQHNLAELPLFIGGRSLGGAPAIHLTYTYPEQVNGLMLECTFAHEPLLLTGLGLPKMLLQAVPSLFGNLRKIAQIKTPLLVIHGERDDVIPVEHGQMLYDAASAQPKTLLRVPDGGHNNLLERSASAYVEAVQKFIIQNQ